MSKQNIVSAYEQSSKIKEIVQQLQHEKNHFQITNLVGSSLSFVISTTFKTVEKPLLIILNDKEEAAYYLNDLEQLVGEKNVLFYPGSYRRPYQIEETDNANVLLRSEVLNRINSRKKPAIIVTYPEALFEQVITKRELEKSTLKLTVGEEVSLDFINEMLFEYSFKRSDFVTEPGEFSVRGGIVDVFSFSNDEPYRIEFFGDEVDSIRTFDVETQLSSEKLKKISIMPNVENKLLEENRESFLKYIHQKTVVFSKNVELVSSRLDKLFEKAKTAFEALSKDINHGKPNELFCDGNLIETQLQEFSLVEIGLSKQESNTVIKFDTTPQPSFNKQFDLLIENLQKNTENGYTNYLLCDNEKQAKRFSDIFGDIDQKMREKTLARFKNGAIKILVATDVAARGIDVNNLTHVVNYSLPDNA